MGALKVSYELVKVLKEKFGEEQAEQIAGCIESSIDDRFDSIRGSLATRDDITNIKSDIFNIKSDISNLKSELKLDIARLDTKIESTSKQTLVWMFAMLVTLLGLTVTLIKLI